MKVSDVTKWIMINDIQASSLFNLIADGVFNSTNVGRETWRSLIDPSFFQENCNVEGLNVQPKISSWGNYVKVRIGIVANNQNHCSSCDSCIGFGISVRSCGGYDLTNTSCGVSRAACDLENRKDPNKNMAAFGYILVQ